MSSCVDNIPSQMLHGVCKRCGKESGMCGLVVERGWKTPCFYCSQCRLETVTWKAFEPMRQDDFACKRERLRDDYDDED